MSMQMNFPFSVKTSRPASVLLSAILMVSGAQAQMPSLLLTPEQRDLLEQKRQAHFLQPERPQQMPSEPNEAPDLVVEAAPLKVSAILNLQGQRQAVINGVTYRERETKDGIHVHRIYPQSVTLTTRGKWGRANLGVRYELAQWPNPPEQKVKLSN